MPDPPAAQSPPPARTRVPVPLRELAYPTASALALLATAIAELFLVPGQRAPLAILLLCLICLALGLLHGMAVQLAFAALWRAPRWAQALFWTLIGCGTGGLLIDQLGAIARLKGKDRALALQVIAVSAAVAVLIACLFTLMQPTRAQPRGAVFTFSRRARYSLAALMVVASALAAYADRTYYVGLYLAAHVALRYASWWLPMFALVLLLPRRASLSPARWGLATALAVTLVLGVATAYPRGPAFLMLRVWSGSLMRAIQTTLDFDQDGYARLLGGGDCDESNPRVNPGAREIPGNGIDDNCLLGDASPRAPAPPLPPAPLTPSPYDVLLITVDSLRPDHLGLYNPKEYGPSGRDVSPNFDAWARQQVVFEQAYTPGAWTSIAMASIMRGQYPRRLRWQRYYETSTMKLLRMDALKRSKEKQSVRQMFPLAFNDPHPTLAGLLRRRGMRSLAIVHDGFSRMLTRGTGVEREFDTYEEVEVLMRRKQDDEGTVDLALRELGRDQKGRRLFMWLHFFGPHSPTQVHAGTRQYGVSQADGYDHEVKYWDQQLPRLFDGIAKRNKPTIVVLTGDHGEVFGANIRMHGFTITEQDIRVPLVISVPGWKPRRVKQVVSTLDLFPTLLALTNTPGPPSDGVDLTPWARDGKKASHRKLISETWRYDARGKPIIDCIAALDGKRKIVLNTVDYSFRSFNQRSKSESPTWVDPRSSDKLLKFLLRYMEDTGGALDPEP